MCKANEDVYLKDWSIEDNGKVKLLYKDDSVLYINKEDFDRAFGPIVSATKSDVERDFAIS